MPLAFLFFIVYNFVVDKGLREGACNESYSPYCVKERDILLDE